MHPVTQNLKILFWTACSLLFVGAFMVFYYAYARIGIGPEHFAAAVLLTIIIAVLTTLYISVKAAMTNPVTSLKHE